MQHSPEDTSELNHLSNASEYVRATTKIEWDLKPIQDPNKSPSTYFLYNKQLKLTQTKTESDSVE